MVSYEQKYLKYKNKYLKIQEHKMRGGGRCKYRTRPSSAYT